MGTRLYILRMEIHPKNSLYMKNLNLPQRRSYSTNNSNPAKLSNFKSAATYENAKLSKKHIMQENKGKSACVFIGELIK
jgi:hypothetical protein